MVKGWAAFSQRNILNLEDEGDPYPSLPNPVHSTLKKTQSILPQKSFRELLVSPSPSQCHSSNVSKLKELNPWADIAILEDVVASVRGDMDKASLLMEEMSPSSEGDSLQFSEEKKESFDIAKEPEFNEENECYLIHRRNAMKQMREASRHSKAAKNAFMRGEHLVAKHHSIKAKEKWVSAEELNSLAAKEILKIRNDANNLWKLDLHGLHKSEATRAVLEHLQEIENLVMLNYKQANAWRMKPLQIVTGVGNHGRGEAVLPMAVKVFLHNNGYHYDELRPGAILVWPKYRQSS